MDNAFTILISGTLGLLIASWGLHYLLDFMYPDMFSYWKCIVAVVVAQTMFKGNGNRWIKQDK